MMEVHPPGSDRRGGSLAEAGGSRFAGDAVELDSIAHRFGDRWVLRGCSLRVPAGVAIALLGSNGAGKTTLLKIMATLLRPTRGGGRVFGYDLAREADEVRQRIGMLGHSPALYDDLTAAENLHFACRMRGLPDEPERITRVLEEVGLAAHRDARVRGFSSGMRRRVALGRILLHPPRLLLMDEPYASFDEDGIRLTHALVRQVVASGGSVVAATHDLPRSLEVVNSAIRVVDGLLEPALECTGVAPSGTRGAGVPLKPAVGTYR